MENSPKHTHKSELKSDDHNHCCDHESKSEGTLEPFKPQSNEILTTFKVSNMDCADEIKAINEALKIDGIKQIQANLMASTVKVLHTPVISLEFLKKRIESTVVRIVSEDSNQVKNQNRTKIYLVASSGIFLVLSLLLNWFKIESAFDKLFYFLSIVLGGSLVFPKAFSALKRKALDMNVLMAVAAIGAVAIGEYSEAAAVVFLFSLSELLESLSVQRARQAISELLKIAPQMASIVYADGTTQEKKVEEILISQVIRIKPGDIISLDGVVRSGSSSVDQAPLTGESIPVVKMVGSLVFAGTINQEGSLDIEVTKIYNETKISQVVKLVEEAQSQRAVSQKFVDRFSQIYTPTVFIVAILTLIIPILFFQGNWHDWLYKSLVLLVIACPCALVLSTPVSIVSSLTALARKGVLIKGGSVLETIGKIKALAVDKTGTLTEGKPAVKEIIKLNTLSEVQILEIAASLEAHSTHPLALAILNYAKEKNIPLKNISNFLNISGKGVQAVVENHTYILGKHNFIHELGICTPEVEKKLQILEEQSLSVVIVAHKTHDACNGEVVGIIALGDQIRSDATKSLEKIRSAGVKSIIMLSGDNHKTASAVGAQVGVNESFGDLLPEDKVEKIKKMKSQFGYVAMIGDGINDAPAMAVSDLGIAMGFVGSDTAIETADMTLMTDDLNQVAVAIKAGQKTLHVIQFNIAFALLTKLIFLVLTFTGYSNLWIAVLADTGATLLVILNSLRLLKVQDV